MMKTVLGAIALTLAVPALAQTAPAPAPEAKKDCCEKMKAEGKECCCKDMAKKGHDMKQHESGGERGHDGHAGHEGHAH